LEEKGDEGGGTGRDGPAESCVAFPERGRGRDSASPAEAGVARSRAGAEPRLQPRVNGLALLMTSRDRRALVIGSVSVAVALLLLRVLPWTVRSALAVEAGLRERAALLARARADLADAAVLRDSAAQLGQALIGLAPKILSGNSAPEAVADLSGRVNLAASGHQAKLERVDPVPDSVVRGRLRRATLRAALECDVRGLVGVLQTLEFGKVALAVRELRVTAVDAGSADRVPEVLRVELTVTGWFLEGPETGSGKRETGEP